MRWHIFLEEGGSWLEPVRVAVDVVDVVVVVVVVVVIFRRCGMAL